jgi:hypothetical protein
MWMECEGIRSNVESVFADTTPAEAFVAAVLEDAPSLIPANEAIQVVVLKEAAYRSVQEGTVIQIAYSK